jgi:hypothetical protein
MTKTIISLTLMLASFQAAAQGVLIGDSPGTPDPAAILEVQSTSQGLLPPRLSTAERDAIAAPPPGLRIYNTDTDCENFYNGTAGIWMELCGSCPPPSAPTASAASTAPGQITWNWNAANGATGYKWSSVPNYGLASDLGNATSFIQSGLNISTRYTIYVWSYHSVCGASAAPLVLTAAICPPSITAPTAGIHVPSGNQIVWKWTGSGAAGFKWNSTNDYNTAIDLYSATSYTQTGLNGSTAYSTYVWAYDTGGCPSAAVELTSSTTVPPCTVGTIGPGGGYVFYCGNAYPGAIGLEAAPSDQGTSTWGCNSTPISDYANYLLTVGSGENNTTMAINACGVSAAKVCGDFVSGSYSDWFLPSRDELALMYTNLKTAGLGGFAATSYWPSNPTLNNSYSINFTTGAQAGASGRTNLYAVRCARKF